MGKTDMDYENKTKTIKLINKKKKIKEKLDYKELLEEEISGKSKD